MNHDIFGFISNTNSLMLKHAYISRYDSTDHSYNPRRAQLLPFVSEKSGDKYAYSIICGLNKTRTSKDRLWIWKVLAQPRIQTFLWLVYHHKLPTTEHLCSRGILISFECSWCGALEESILHVLWECTTAKNLLSSLEIPPSKKGTFVLLIDEWLELNCEAYELHSLSIPWKIVFSCALWPLWKRRNKCIFEGYQPNTTLLHRKCLELSTEYFASMKHAATASTTTIQVRWSPPTKHWIKLNIDGSVRHCLGSAGAGGVLRNHLRGWIKGFSRILGYCNNHHAECWALRDGLIMALNMGIQFLLVELDVKIVCDLVSEMINDNLSLMPIIFDCRMLLGRFEGLRMQHIYQEANMVADQLARLASDSTRIPISLAGNILYF
ncbi:hypothetical protein CRG98_030119 [Punica granatum]|uniref:Uncharacterized protein n=1 Tax=Punica granatum TaxID=22663 RepID=A0A2I0IZU1_PUNGR|nr:hypothetical protein CRG98_030119 [Punica granatum]